MNRRKGGLVFGILVFMLLVGVFGVVLNVPQVWGSGTIYIRTDGSIDPPTAPISTVDNATYTFVGDISDSIVVERDNIVIDGADYSIGGGGGTGMDLSGRSNVTIRKTNIEGFDDGIYLSVSFNNSITENNITTDTFDQSIVLSDSSYNSITRNNITANDAYGVSFYNSDYNSIMENLIIGMGGSGVELESSSGNNISGNIMSGGGISLSSSSNNNTVSGNNMNPGVVGLIESSYNIVRGNNVTIGDGFGAIGVILGGSNNVIDENNITNNWCGIQLQYLSHNNSISENNITNNEYGIGGGGGLTVFSYNNTFSRNNIKNNKHDGISLYHAENTIVWGNTIANNGEYGVNLVGMGQSSNNIFYHNNFINNTNHVDTWEEAIWDNGYPSGGNYWDNYTGVDANNDGIGDMLHDISAWGYNNVDRYPLMVPYVIPEFPSFLILALLMVATLLAVMVCTRKER
jgi:parallel beta-helix repeat protein